MGEKAPLSTLFCVFKKGITLMIKHPLLELASSQNFERQQVQYLLGNRVIEKHQTGDMHHVIRLPHRRSFQRSGF